MRINSWSAIYIVKKIDSFLIGIAQDFSIGKTSHLCEVFKNYNC